MFLLFGPRGNLFLKKDEKMPRFCWGGGLFALKKIKQGRVGGFGFFFPRIFHTSPNFQAKSLKASVLKKFNFFSLKKKKAL